MLVGEAIRDVCPGLGTFHIRISSDLFTPHNSVPRTCLISSGSSGRKRKGEEKEAEQANFTSWRPIYLS